eukprot:3212473-Amphidinium_carterae.2
MMKTSYQTLAGLDPEGLGSTDERIDRAVINKCANQLPNMINQRVHKMNLRVYLTDWDMTHRCSTELTPDPGVDRGDSPSTVTPCGDHIVP